ncbi:MAG: GNAT family N-acetyltransferase [Candidatus Marinimicrobia bacterium]|nr:GNAT family N-acetyltransferase [Candidatus Neomarinimicrobiota bacterium]
MSKERRPLMMHPEFNEELSGPRVLLRQTRPDPGTAEVMFRAIDTSRQHLRPWCPWERTTCRIEDSMKYLREKEEATASGKLVEYGIYVRESGGYIGNISLFNLNAERRSGEIGYWLTASATGNGYMHEALRVLEKESFLTLGLNRIQITCDVHNTASAEVIRKCGYTFEGTLREDRFDPYENAMRNTFVFSKLRAEFDREQNPAPSGQKNK